MRKRHAFTLIELLVVIAIIALLLSVLLPGLKRAKDYAKQVICATRLKQTGVGIRMYADAFDGYLPDDHDLDGNRERHTYAAYRADKPQYIYPSGKLKPLRLAYLYELDYIDTPEIFYCPGNSKRLTPQYVYETYTYSAPWGTRESAEASMKITGSPNAWIRTGYTYYPVEIDAKIDSTYHAPVELGLKLFKLNPSIPMMTDLIHNRPSISHQHNKFYKLNALYNDAHVSTCNDQAIFKDDFFDPMGGRVWVTLDSNSFPFLAYYDTAIYTVFRAIGP